MQDRFGDKIVYPSIPAMFQARSRADAALAVIFRKEFGQWRAYTAQDIQRKVERWAFGLKALGVKKGDRVAIVSQTRLEWGNADMAILHLGAVTVGVYPNLIADEVAYQLAHSESKVVFVEDKVQLEKVRSVRDKLPALERIVVFDTMDASLTDPETGAPVDEMAIGADDLAQRGDVEANADPHAVEKAWRAVTHDDLATIIYTSGTTGPPKGALLTHGNLCFVVASASSVVASRGPEDFGISFLPMAHALQRVANYLATYNGVRGAIAESVDKLLDNWRELRPTVQASVPRIWEKIHARIQGGLEGQPWHRRRLFDWALRAGKESAHYRKRGQRLPFLLGMRWSLARKFWRGVVLPRLGFDRVRFLTSGGAPIAVDLLEFFYAMDILILEAWGLTETAAPATLNRLDDFKFGTVGKPIPGVEVKVAADGELLVRGPGVFRGYYKNDEATKEAFDEQGFFRTGDIGTIDDEGFVRITDRKKNLIVTSLGKKIPPQNLENLFRESPFLGPCLVHGDRRKFLSAIFTLDPDEIRNWAKARGIDEAALDALAKHEAIQRLVAQAVERANGRLSGYEQIKKWAVVGDVWTVEDGALTPTLKVKRKALEERYRAILERFYEGDS